MSKFTCVSIALVAMIMGLITAFQFRAIGGVDQSVSYDRVQELTMEKKRLEEDLEHLQEKAADLVAKVEEAGKGSKEAVAAFRDELAEVEVHAGLVPVSGPGVEIILESSFEPAGLGGSYIKYTIKDDDILKVINELRGAGAEALAINGQRIMATSEIRMAGHHINVNLTRLSPPYIITAVGNSAALKSSLEIKDGLGEYLNDLGITVSIHSGDEVLVPAYNGTLRFDYAKVSQK